MIFVGFTLARTHASQSGNLYLPNVEYFFVGLSGLALLVGIGINILDYNYAKAKDPNVRAQTDLRYIIYTYMLVRVASQSAMR